MIQGWGEVPEEIVIADICEKFGWTYEEYQNQPFGFLEIIRLKMKLEREEERRKIKRVNA